MRFVLSFIGSAALAAVAGVATSASADWLPNQPIFVNGSFTPLEDPMATWGTWAGQGLHSIGTVSQYTASVPQPVPIFVTSILGTPTDLFITLDFADFPFFEIGTHQVIFPDLKAPGFTLDALANAGSIVVDGTSVIWTAEALDLPGDGIVNIFITQVPAPGAALLLPMVGLARRRRRLG